MALAVIVFASSFTIYRAALKSHPVLYIPAVVELVLLIIGKSMTFFIFPMIARTQLSKRAILRNAFLLLFINHNGLKALAVLLVELAVLLIGLIAYPLSLLFYPLFGISFVFLCSAFLSWPSIQEYVIKENL